jgi:hypothetical protein
LYKYLPAFMLVKKTLIKIAYAINTRPNKKKIIKSKTQEDNLKIPHFNIDEISIEIIP